MNEPSLSDYSRNQRGHGRAFWIRALPVLLAASVAASPGHAIVGGVPDADGLGRAVVIIIGSRGNVCSGALIAPTVVLTAGHCISAGTNYRIIDKTTSPPRLITVQKAQPHPQYNAQAISGHRATADVALLLLPSPVPGKTPAALGVPRTPIRPGARFTIAGIGETSPGADDVGTLRAASLAVTGQPGTLQVRLTDPVTNNLRAGIGACTGDSGAPVFEDQAGNPVVVGVVSWSTGPNNSDGCGGLTGTTPLTLYRDWIVKTVRDWKAGF